jgi:hypothetical protein
MNEATQVAGILAISVCAVLLSLAESPLMEKPRVKNLLVKIRGTATIRNTTIAIRMHTWRQPLLLIITLLSLLAYFNFGTFHGRGHIHHWEQFHYTLSAKYFDELRYDGLYVGSVEAQKQARFLPLPKQIRDLRNDEVIDIETAEAHGREVRARFSNARWAEFYADNLYFLQANHHSYMDLIRKDHGFNATPTWVAVAGLLVRDNAINSDSAGLLAWVDPLLMAVALFAVWRRFGLTTGLWCAIVFGTSYAGRYYWVGGSLLRLDWLAAVMLAGSAVQARQFTVAGALLGYATMQRVFPLFFMLLPSVLALWQLSARQPLRWFIALGGGYTLAVAAGFIAGSVATGSLYTWLEFYQQISLHNKTWLTNNVGLENILYYDIDTYLRRYADFSLPEPWIHWQQHMDGVRARWHWLHTGIALLALGGVGYLTRRASALEAMLLGMVPIFCFLNLTTYYWLMLCLLPLVGRLQLTLAVLLLNIALCADHFVQPQFEWRYGAMSWLLLGLFVYWVCLIWFSAADRKIPVPESR